MWAGKTPGIVPAYAAAGTRTASIPMEIPMGTSSNSRKVHFTKLLADNARAYGYLNGKRIGKAEPKKPAEKPAGIKR